MELPQHTNVNTSKFVNLMTNSDEVFCDSVSITGVINVKH